MNALAPHQRNSDLTRQTLLQAAFEEIWLHGYRGTSIDQILARTGVTKGALYHHFKNKTELGYAVLDEVIKPMVASHWVTALSETDDPLTAVLEIIRGQVAQFPNEAENYGCPLNNLAQEMSPIEEGFRIRIKNQFDSWRRGIAAALRQGQAHGKVRRDIDADDVSTFIVASIEGILGLAKNSQSAAVLESSFAVLELFLDSLRPAASSDAG